MKSSDTKAPKFDSKWWTANKAKSADADNKFTAALKAYEDAKKAMSAAVHNKPTTKVTPAHLKAVVDALGTVKTEAAKKKNDPKLGTFQKETKEALASYEKLADLAIKNQQQVSKDKVVTAGLNDQIKGNPVFRDFMKAVQMADSYGFLHALMGNAKRDRTLYTRFISLKSPTNVNISGEPFKEFEAIEAAIVAGTTPDTPAAWAGAPWNEAGKQVLEMLTANRVYPTYQTWATAFAWDNKLP